MAWNIHCDACGKHIQEGEPRAHIAFEIISYVDAEICLDCAERPDQLLHILRLLRCREKEQAVIAQEYEDEG